MKSLVKQLGWKSSRDRRHVTGEQYLSVHEASSSENTAAETIASQNGLVVQDAPAWKGAGRHYLRDSSKAAGCHVCHNLYTHDENNIGLIVKMDPYDLAESAFNGDCQWCALVHRAITELGANLPDLFSKVRPGQVRVLARPDEPIMVDWVEAVTGRTTAEIFREQGMYLQEYHCIAMI